MEDIDTSEFNFRSVMTSFAKLTQVETFTFSNFLFFSATYFETIISIWYRDDDSQTLIIISMVIFSSSKCLGSKGLKCVILSFCSFFLSNWICFQKLINFVVFLLYVNRGYRTCAVSVVNIKWYFQLKLIAFGNM